MHAAPASVFLLPLLPDRSLLIAVIALLPARAAQTESRSHRK